MCSAAHRGSPIAVHLGRSRMRASVQMVGAAVLGLGLAASVDSTRASCSPSTPSPSARPSSVWACCRRTDPEALTEPHDRCCHPPR
jgi:hypothetical protein